MPLRRSSRLRGSIGTPGRPNNIVSRRLSSLVERDETPTHGVESVLDSIASSSMAPPTPATAGRINPAFDEMHPGKGHSTSSPPFDFRFARPAPELGPEAQRMMDELREEALRIKVKLIAEREEEIRNATVDNSGAVGGRKMATAKGKVERFSDIHMAEFKKMDSIAEHPSAFRAQPGRFTQLKASLKRSPSKAMLDGREQVSQETEAAMQPEALENATPAKRARVADAEEGSRSLTAKPETPTLSRSRSILSSITTPTHASLARAASVKHPTKIPSLSNPPSKQSLTTPRRLTKSSTTNNIGVMKRSDSIQNFSNTTSKFDRVKSMLRRPPPSPEKTAATLPTSIPSLKSPNKPNLNKELPSVPTTPGHQRSMNLNHVNFTPKTLTSNVATIQKSPSPLKSGIPRSKSNMTLGAVNYPSLSSIVIANDSTSKEVYYPDLTPSRPLPRPPQQSKAKSSPPSAPSTFTFRSDKTISFGMSPQGFGSSPGQASIRQVRPSIFSTAIPRGFPDSDKENIGGLPAIPHGMPNKKRRRVDSDDEKEKEAGEGSPTKKRKGPVTDLATLMAPKLLAEKMAQQSRIPSPSKKGVLSLNRLNMLARPKMRK